MNNNPSIDDLVLQLVTNKDWEEIYNLSSILRKEVSVLVDANDDIWIDWGNQSLVALSPPYGSELPFKLWVHTHPNMPAYWSVTDQASLQIASQILDTAYVLGRDGLLFTKSNKKANFHCIPGLEWSSEAITPWEQVKEGNL